MSLQDKLNELLGNDTVKQKQNSGAARNDKESEALSAVELKARILHMFAEQSKISGKHDFFVGHTALVEASLLDPKFKEAMNAVVEKLIFIFHSNKSEDAQNQA